MGVVSVVNFWFSMKIVPAHKLMRPRTSHSSRGKMSAASSANAVMIRTAPVMMRMYGWGLNIENKDLHLNHPRMDYSKAYIFKGLVENGSMFYQKLFWEVILNAEFHSGELPIDF